MVRSCFVKDVFRVGAGELARRDDVDQKCSIHRVRGASLPPDG
jgi:hypothetical protein